MMLPFSDVSRPNHNTWRAGLDGNVDPRVYFLQAPRIRPGAAGIGLAPVLRAIRTGHPRLRAEKGRDAATGGRSRSGRHLRVLFGEPAVRLRPEPRAISRVPQSLRGSRAGTDQRLARGRT